MAKLTKGPWKAVKGAIRKHQLWQVRDHDTIAVVYTSHADATLMAASRQMFDYCQRRAREGDTEARALVAKVLP
jgi:hypothetical protein